MTIVNDMLQPKDKFKKKAEQKNHWQHCKRAHAILMDILSLYGPEIFHPLWNEFKYFKLISKKKAILEMDNCYDALDTKMLNNYDDFWHFTDQLLNHGSQNLDSKVCIDF